MAPCLSRSDQCSHCAAPNQGFDSEIMENPEKLIRIAHLQSQARKIFTTDEAIAQWLASPAPALDGLAPIDMLDTDMGIREVEAVLNGIAHGNVM
jgi:putative toxin-antitoxin system antitoxin component (TIGR02293 family)